ncbi:MAG: DUF2273 domain-containing protein [Clostridiales bacterium]|nr:DUF2273 domain-containing protein [Clostridiales bacterium]
MTARQTKSDKSSMDNGVSITSTPNDGTNVTTKEALSTNKEFLFTKIYKENPNTVILSILGLVIALCFIIIGFWGTILIILMTGMGFIYGQYRDKALWIYYMIKKMLK